MSNRNKGTYYVTMKTFRPLELSGTGHVLRHPEVEPGPDEDGRFLPRCDVARFEQSACDLGTAAEVVRRFNLLPDVLREVKAIRAGISPLGYVGDDVSTRLNQLVKLLEG